MATRLSKLEIDEVSGVANPANQLPAFLVVKGHGKPLSEMDDAELAEVEKEVDRMESDFAILYSSLKACEQYLAGDTPEEVTSAVATLVSYIEGLFNETPDEETEPVEAPTDVEASEDGKPLGFLAKLLGSRREEETAEVATKSEEPEAEVTKTEEPAPAEEPEAAEPQFPDELVKALQDLPSFMEEQRATAEALREATGGIADRVGRLEATRKSVDIEPVAIPETTEKADRGAAALRSVLVNVASRPGHRETIG